MKDDKVLQETAKLLYEHNILMEMANLSAKRTGLKVSIWSDGDGIHRNVGHNNHRIKIGKTGQFSVSVTIEKEPRILASSKNISDSDMNKIKDAMKYIGRNCDLFEKHYSSTEDVYDDDDLKDDLRKRGEYK